jgi:hypothetical protein
MSDQATKQIKIVDANPAKIFSSAVKPTLGHSEMAWRLALRSVCRDAKKKKTYRQCKG